MNIGSALDVKNFWEQDNFISEKICNIVNLVLEIQNENILFLKFVFFNWNIRLTNYILEKKKNFPKESNIG